jgi:hypothetical protein
MHSRILAAVAFLMFIPAVSMAQSDLCTPSLPSVPNEAKAEQLRIQAQERMSREVERRDWEVKMITVKNAVPDRNLNALCIFRIEVVSQPALRLVQVRAPKELMAAVEDALKRLDVPPPPLPAVKSVELTAYVLVMADAPEPGLMPLPTELQSVANQVKNILPGGTLYLADTVVARGVDNQRLSINGGTSLSASVSVRENLVRLDNLSVETNTANFQTSIDIPVGTQVVVGKATSREKKKPVILVITAKLLN